jgi:hypothetical protein
MRIIQQVAKQFSKEIKELIQVVSKIYDEVVKFLQVAQHCNHDKLSSKVSHKGVSYLIFTHPNTVTSIVNQIHASIISEAIGKLGRYE